MPKYLCRAKRGLSETVELTIAADGEESALAKVAASGLFPISISEIKKGAVPGSPKRQKRVRAGMGQTLMFAQQLGTLVRAKVELLSALGILEEQAERGAFRQTLTELREAVKEGKFFSEALEQHPKSFPPLFVSLVKAGEASGRLDESLEEIRLFLAREETLKRRIAVAMAYPLLVLLVGFVSLFVLLSFVIPRLAPVLMGLGKELPLITRVVLAFAAFFNRYWPVMVVAAAVCAFIVVRGKAVWKRTLWTKATRNLPILHRLAENQEIARLARSLSLLLKGGVQALQALKVAAEGIEGPKLREGLEAACREVSEGQGVAISLEQSTDLPAFFVKMVAVGEKSGRLAEVLGELSVSYTEQAEADIAVVSSLIEPLLILGIGLVLGCVVIAILLPTFQISQMVR